MDDQPGMTVGELRAQLGLYPEELQVRVLWDVGTTTIEKSVGCVVDSSEWDDSDKEAIVYLAGVTCRQRSAWSSSAASSAAGRPRYTTCAAA